MLRRDDLQVEEFSAVADLEARSEQRQVRYLGAIDTSSLQPGSYRLLTYLPDRSTDEPAVLAREFTLTGQQPRP